MSRDKQKMGRKVGLYLTISFHLVLLIILLIASIHTMVKKESSFVLDFTKQEALEKEKEEIKFKEDVSKELDRMLATNRRAIRNVAVDANAPLKDDRSARPNEVYEQAKDLQRKLDASKRDALAQAKKDEESVDLEQEKKPETKEKATYSGPSVISYKLDGRKARYLPVPAYKGYGSGDVLVEIIVNQKGRVTKARVMESVSSTDLSLHEYAIEAAMRSRFAASSTAEPNQTGSILYRFIGQ